MGPSAWTAAAALCLGVFPSQALAASSGLWVLTDDGKHWMYCYSPAEPAKDQWIEDDGKLYYLDSRGYMKTGWLKNPDDGRRYYMGADGAMCRNTFSEDGHYVGPDGAELPAYDQYRKEAKKLLKAAQKELGSGGFFAADLNGDGWRDLAVAEGTDQLFEPVQIAFWDPEEKTFLDIARFEPGDESQQQTLYIAQDGTGSVLKIQWLEGGLQIFSMDGEELAVQWDLQTGPDDWGGRQFWADGETVGLQEWQRLREEALQQLEEAELPSYAPLTEKDAADAVDRILTSEEAAMWEE